MTHDDRQAHLLDMYLDALAQDRNATPPPRLDPELAEMARLLAADNPTAPVPPMEWDAFTGDLPARNGHYPPPTLDNMEQEIMTTTYPQQTEPRPYILPLTLVAATVTVVTFIVIMLASTGGGPSQFAVEIQNATPTAPPMATPTPIPMTAAPPAAGGGGGGVSGPAGPRASLDTIFIEFPPEEIIPGETYTTQLRPEAPFATFRYVAPADTVLMAVFAPESLPASIQTSVQSAPTENAFGGGGGGGGGGGPMTRPEPFILQEGDTLQIALRQWSAGVVNSQPTEMTVRFEEVEPAEIPVNGARTVDISQAQPYAVYQFDALASVRYTLRADGADGFNPALRAQGAGMGGLFGTDSDSGEGTNAELYRLASDFHGETYVFVFPEYSGDTGAVTLSLTTERPPNLSDGPQTVRLAGNIPTAVVMANGEAGSTGTVTLRPLQGNASLQVTITDGERILTSTSSENASQLLRDFTFPDQEEVYIKVSRYTVGGAMPMVGAVDVELSLAP